MIVSTTLAGLLGCCAAVFVGTLPALLAFGILFLLIVPFMPKGWP